MTTPHAKTAEELKMPNVKTMPQEKSIADRLVYRFCYEDTNGVLQLRDETDGHCFSEAIAAAIRNALPALLAHIATLEGEISMLRREVSREGHLKFMLRRLLDDREKFLAEQRAADDAARAANTPEQQEKSNG